MGTATTTLGIDTFESAIQKPGIVVMDFWAPWCGPCRLFAPVFERVAEKNPDVVFAKVNTEEEQELAGILRITSIPTVMVFRDGILLFSEPGMLPEKALTELVAQVRALDMEQVRADIEAQEHQQTALVA